MRCEGRLPTEMKLPTVWTALADSSLAAGYDAIPPYPVGNEHKAKDNARPDENKMCEAQID